MFTGSFLWLEAPAVATHFMDIRLLPLLGSASLCCPLSQQFSQVNTHNQERHVLISHKYLFILAEGKKVIYISSCLQQIVEHQEANKLGIKRIKCICSCLVVWMRCLNVLICLVPLHRCEGTTFSHSSQPAAAHPASLCQ